RRPRGSPGHAARPPSPACCGAAGRRPGCTAPRTPRRPDTAATSTPRPRPGRRTTTEPSTLTTLAVRAVERPGRGEPEQPGQVLCPVGLPCAEGVQRAEQPVRGEGE